MRMNLRIPFSIALIAALAMPFVSYAGAVDYTVVDTGQRTGYDTTFEISIPQSGQAFYGQDVNYLGPLPSYTVSVDNKTVYDHNTGLTWVKTPDTNGDSTFDSYDKLTWAEFQAYPATLNAQNFGGYNDWRTPTIKELYSLIDFNGIDPNPNGSGTTGLIPFIDRAYFDFVYGDTSVGDRIIDAQYWSNTQYVSTIFMGDAGVFGVNFADGRIKCYPRDMGPGGTSMTMFARFVRGDAFGANDFVDNGDGTITDQATGLTWMQNDSGVAYNWEEALDYAENLVFAGHDDWRLPNAKELQSIVDYTRSPDTTNSAAIDPLFNVSTIIDETGSTNYPFFWSGTTHITFLSGEPGSKGCYVAFGEALGYMGPPGMGQWMDVHGAGAQRSDPKFGDPSSYPYGHGPQGDAIRIYNFVRCVRGGIDTSLSADAYALSAASGGSIDLTLDAGVAQANRNYFMMGCMGGTHPGYTFGSGVTLPLNPDLFTDILLQLVTSPACLNFMGALDGTGAGTATLNTYGPLPAGMAGSKFWFAYLLYDPIDFASNPIAIEIDT